MDLKFDANQDFQLDAIRSVVDVFSGQQHADLLSTDVLLEDPDSLFATTAFANTLTVPVAHIGESLREVQKRNGCEGDADLGDMRFSIEMETGTGKTYVYLRTIFELRKHYGFSKFVIVVPSVAIREGVLQTIRQTKAHFADLYDNEPCDAWVYDAKAVTKVRHFASSSALQIVIINIDAFNKSTNVIHQELDRMNSFRPIEFLRAARPIVIIDEPQSVDNTEKARNAIKGLNPLFELRYSATHREAPNPLYRLTPVDAYERRLVKQIEVDEVEEADDRNRAYVRFVGPKPRKKGAPAAQVEIDARVGTEIKRKKITVAVGEGLYEKSGSRDIYRDWRVSRIRAVAGEELLELANPAQVQLTVGKAHGGRTDDVRRLQVRQAVLNQLETELELRKRHVDGKLPSPIKPLTLVFIDRVANYREADGGHGKYALWFEEAYEEYSKADRFAALTPPPVALVHDGYFAQDKDGAYKDSRERNSTAADNEAYELIMRNKERLLDPAEPLRFIFTHSALREGWDNPNVFQICTLNDAQVVIRKRQEIGRGLRLCVMANGERCTDPDVNRLIVIANESYAEFAASLQAEIEADCGVSFGAGQGPKRKRARKRLLLKKEALDLELFKALWKRIARRTRYRVAFDTPELVELAVKCLKELPGPTKPSLVANRWRVEGFDAETGVVSAHVDAQRVEIDDVGFLVPDLVTIIERDTHLTRATIGRILTESGRLGDAFVNPQEFLGMATDTIQSVLTSFIVDGIQYEPLPDAAGYECMLLEGDVFQDELNSYVDRVVATNKSIYDGVEFDSDVERQFAEALNGRDDVELFIKLPAGPRGFTVDTPIGSYHPDWALVKRDRHGDRNLYLVRETKGSTDEHDLRDRERMKIRCGRRHFGAIGADYEVVTNTTDL